MTNINKKFRDRFTKEQRLNEYKKIREKYPDRVPVIIDIEGRGLYLKRRKYLVEHEMLFANFVHVIRQRLCVSPNESLFFLYENSIPCHSHTIGRVFNERVSCDGFLVLTVSKENTFGASYSPCE